MSQKKSQQSQKKNPPVENLPLVPTALEVPATQSSTDLPQDPTPLEKTENESDPKPTETLSEILETEPAPISPPKQNNPLANALREYCGEVTIAMVLKSLCEKVPEVLPNYRTWPVNVDPTPLIRKLITSPDYVESVIPILYMMLGENVKNIQWSARTLIGLATFRIIEGLPYASYQASQL